MFIYVESECRGYTPGSCGALLASLVFVRDGLKGREMKCVDKPQRGWHSMEVVLQTQGKAMDM